MKDFTTNINGMCLEYFDSDHVYLVDGIEVPSITTILKSRFGNKYQNINTEVLKRAAEAGTAVHEAIERYIVTGEESPFPELRNFKFLQRKIGFQVLSTEVPVILCADEPIAAGRLDLVLEMDGKIGGADIKRTSSLDKDYLFYQLNLYRIAYRQCYGVEWEFLNGIHLRNDVRRFVDIPINESEVWNLVRQYLAA